VSLLFYITSVPTAVRHSVALMPRHVDVLMCQETASQPSQKPVTSSRSVSAKTQPKVKKPPPSKVYVFFAFCILCTYSTHV